MGSNGEDNARKTASLFLIGWVFKIKRNLGPLRKSKDRGNQKKWKREGPNRDIQTFYLKDYERK